MSRPDEPIRPMPLGNMRQGVRGLDVTCRACGHHTEVNVDAWPENIPAARDTPTRNVIWLTSSNRFSL